MFNYGTTVTALFPLGQFGNHRGLVKKANENKENYVGLRVPQLTEVSQESHLVLIPATIPRGGYCPARPPLPKSVGLSVSESQQEVQQVAGQDRPSYRLEQ